MKMKNVIKPSKYAKKNTGVRAPLVDEAERMKSAFENKLVRSRTFFYQGGLTAEMVRSDPRLEPFICWTCNTEVPGVYKKKSGGTYNNKMYYCVSGGKNAHYMAHKLNLCCSLGISYRELEERNQETSHLCHSDDGCWRHVLEETHAENVSRNSGAGCSGWIYDLKAKQLYCLCLHTPHKCMHLKVIQTLEEHTIGIQTVPVLPRIVPENL